ncbi:MAG: TetR family transcriptional regulator, partial [Sedimenticola sp.]|nr:TetR family transcriptional regulator [Sedimenticola sp.]
MRSARKLFSRDGYQAVTVRRLAAEAGVTPAMVNYHFGNKQGLYLAVIEETVAPVLRQFSRMAARGPLERGSLFELLQSYLELLRRERWLPPLVAREVLLRDGPLQKA